MNGKLTTPSVTPLSLPALVAVVAKLLAAFSIVHLSGGQVEALNDAALLAGGVFGLDVVLRGLRAKYLGARIPQDPPIGDPARLPEDEGVTHDLLTGDGEPPELVDVGPASEDPEHDPAEDKPADFR